MRTSSGSSPAGRSCHRELTPLGELAGWEVAPLGAHAARGACRQGDRAVRKSSCSLIRRRTESTAATLTRHHPEASPRATPSAGQHTDGGGLAELRRLSAIDGDAWGMDHSSKGKRRRKQWWAVAGFEKPRLSSNEEKIRVRVALSCGGRPATSVRYFSTHRT